MFKKRIEKVKEYVDDHKTEIVMGVGLVAVTGMSIVLFAKNKNLKVDVIKLKDKVKTLSKMAKDGVVNEIMNYESEYRLLSSKLSNMDMNKHPNKYINGPAIEKRLEELSTLIAKAKMRVDVCI